MPNDLGMEIINPLPNDKTSDGSKLKAFADDKIDESKKLKFGLGRIENTGGMEKMLVTSIFSFSHNVFKNLPLQGC